jgi:hypothetical protein
MRYDINLSTKSQGKAPIFSPSASSQQNALRSEFRVNLY